MAEPRRITAPDIVHGSIAVRARAPAAGYCGAVPLTRKDMPVLYPEFLGGAPPGLNLPLYLALMFEQGKAARAAELWHPLLLPQSRSSLWTVHNNNWGKQYPEMNTIV